MALTPLSDIHRILISRTDELGDVILTLPLAVAIRRRLPDVDLAFLVRPNISHLVERIDQIDRAFMLPDNGKGKAIFQEYHPQAVIFAEPEFRLALDAVRARIDVRIGPGYMWYSSLFTRWVYDRRSKWGSHEAEFELNMLEPLIDGPFDLEMPELPPAPDAVTEARLRLEGEGITGPYVIIHPVGRPYLPQYPVSRFATIGRTLLEQRNDLAVVITAGQGENLVAQELKNQIDMEDRVAVIDTLSPNGVSELVRNAACFISSASDGAHLAGLVQTPAVVLFPGNPPYWPQRRRPIGPDIVTLVPDRNEPLPSSGSQGQNPESVVARIAPDRVTHEVLELLRKTDRD